MFCLFFQQVLHQLIVWVCFKRISNYEDALRGWISFKLILSCVLFDFYLILNQLSSLFEFLSVISLFELNSNKKNNQMACHKALCQVQIFNESLNKVFTGRKVLRNKSITDKRETVPRKFSSTSFFQHFMNKISSPCNRSNWCSDAKFITCLKQYRATHNSEPICRTNHYLNVQYFCINLSNCQLAVMSAHLLSRTAVLLLLRFS